jgi:hypothetical protein
MTCLQDQRTRGRVGGTPEPESWREQPTTGGTESPGADRAIQIGRSHAALATPRSGRHQRRTRRLPRWIEAGAGRKPERDRKFVSSAIQSITLLIAATPFPLQAIVADTRNKSNGASPL